MIIIKPLLAKLTHSEKVCLLAKLNVVDAKPCDVSLLPEVYLLSLFPLDDELLISKGLKKSFEGAFRGLLDSAYKGEDESIQQLKKLSLKYTDERYSFFSRRWELPSNLIDAVDHMEKVLNDEGRQEDFFDCTENHPYLKSLEAGGINSEDKRLREGIINCMRTLRGSMQTYDLIGSGWREYYGERGSQYYRKVYTLDHFKVLTEGFRSICCAESNDAAFQGLDQVFLLAEERKLSF